VTLEPLEEADLDLVGGYASRALAGRVGVDAGFGSGNVTDSTASATVSWSAGQAGGVAVRLTAAPWAATPAPRAFVLRLTSQTAGAAVSATAARAIVVLATGTGAVIQPTLSGGGTPSVGDLTVMMGAILVLATLARRA